MRDPQSISRFDQLEDEIASMRERIARYRRAMLGSRVTALGGMCTMLIVYTLLPALGSTAVVLTAIVCAIGGTVWLGATKSSSDELAAALARAEADKSALFDEVAARNGWLDSPRPSCTDPAGPAPVGPGPERRRLPLR